MPSYNRNYARTTHATPLTFDYRSLQAIFTPTTEEPQQSPITASSRSTEPTPGGREGKKVKFSDHKREQTANNKEQHLVKDEKTPLKKGEPALKDTARLSVDTRTNMPQEFLNPVVEATTKRSHKGHHHLKQREREKKDLKIAAELVQRLEKQENDGKGDASTKPGAKTGTDAKKTKKHHHHHRNKV